MNGTLCAYPSPEVNDMKTIWTESVSLPARNHLPGNLSADAAVIGGGMAGILSSFATDTELPFSVKGTVYFPNQAQFHPLKFLEAVSSLLTIYEKTPVISVKDTGTQQLLVTPYGTVSARDVVFAC